MLIHKKKQNRNTWKSFVSFSGILNIYYRHNENTSKYGHIMWLQNRFNFELLFQFDINSSSVDVLTTSHIKLLRLYLRIGFMFKINNNLQFVIKLFEISHFSWNTLYFNVLYNMRMPTLSINHSKSYIWSATTKKWV